jgi:adenosylhomocysteine nucleosidase
MKNDLLIITALESELNRDALPEGVKIVYTGVGKINAALASYKAIAEHQPKLIVNFGTVGKINPALTGLVSIGKVVQRDMIAEPLAPRGMTPFCPNPYEYFSVSGDHICGTGDNFVTSQDPWLGLQKVDVVDMELFAIAATAFQFNIPWRSYKYITDEANSSAGNEWQGNMHQGHDLYMQKLHELL